MARRAWAGCGIPYHCALTLRSAGAGGADPRERWGRPEIPGHARRDDPDDSRSTALQAQMGKPRLREARGFLKGPQLGRGRARPESYLRLPSLLLPGLRAPRTAAPFVQGHQQWRKGQAGGVSCAPTEDAKPWPCFTRSSSGLPLHGRDPKEEQAACRLLQDTGLPRLRGPRL